MPWQPLLALPLRFASSHHASVGRAGVAGQGAKCRATLVGVQECAEAASVHSISTPSPCVARGRGGSAHSVQATFGWRRVRGGGVGNLGKGAWQLSACLKQVSANVSLSVPASSPLLCPSHLVICTPHLTAPPRQHPPWLLVSDCFAAAASRKPTKRGFSALSVSVARVWVRLSCRIRLVVACCQAPLCRAPAHTHARLPSCCCPVAHRPPPKGKVECIVAPWCSRGVRAGAVGAVLRRGAVFLLRAGVPAALPFALAHAAPLRAAQPPTLACTSATCPGPWTTRC